MLQSLPTSSGAQPPLHDICDAQVSREPDYARASYAIVICAIAVQRSAPHLVYQNQSSDYCTVPNLVPNFYIYGALTFGLKPVYSCQV